MSFISDTKDSLNQFNLRLHIYFKHIELNFLYQIIELIRKKSTYARMKSTEAGSILISGSFKKQNVDPDFKVMLNLIKDPFKKLYFQSFQLVNIR